MSTIIQLPRQASNQAIKLSLRQQLKEANRRLAKAEQERDWLTANMTSHQVMLRALVNKFQLSVQNVEDITNAFVAKLDEEAKDAKEQENGSGG